MTTLGTITASLAGSGTPYLTAQVRACDAGHCRYQTQEGNHGIEVTVTASAKLTEWIAAIPATEKSKAGTSAMYVPCQIRPDAEGMRVQIAGPALNVPFGVEYLCHSWKDTGAIAAAPSGTVAPVTKDEPDGDPDEVADPDDDDEKSDK